MASSENSQTSLPPLTPPSLEELSRRGVRTLLMPWIIRLASTSPPSSQSPREAVVLINLRTGSISMVDGANDIDALLRTKDGPLPASKASIEAMPVVEVKEEGFECAICLTEFEVNGVAKEMPCKHRYHAGCIEKWLGVHGSCPICRYKMPAEEKKENMKGGGGEEAHSDDDVERDGDDDDDTDGDGNGNGDGDGNGGEGGRDGAAFVFHIFVAGSRNGSGLHMDWNRNENESVDGNSDSGSGGDNDGSATHDMEIDDSPN